MRNFETVSQGGGGVMLSDFSTLILLQNIKKLGGKTF